LKKGFSLFIQSFDEFAEMARRGEAKKLTVTTDEIFKEKYGEMDFEEFHNKIPFDLEVFPLGKIIREGVSHFHFSPN
jgi:hypothetical protein